ncbi:MAG: proton-dependent oligopeptide transporter POT family [Hyphomonadaceae bacterium]|nr:MAG: proton-dependent oligopeptide transporter POT family [Hyphomonadaceae bacterium]KAF0185890.1 MAG: proton-dependent oligopeptide transporter POT family [Hyphomonadaceae bacterium]
MTITETSGLATGIDENKHDKSFLGHPKGLGFLAFTEAWERFSYYGMQSLLVLYMAKHLLLPGHIENIAFFSSFRKLFGNLEGAALSSAIFGTYAAMVYFTPTLGGLIADKLLGKRKTVLAGALFMALGHFLMAFEVSFLIALLSLVIGSGLFKGNLASQIGSLYKPSDLRRADAFQIYYLAINAGVIAAPLIAGTLGEKIGWHWGFGAAGVGMLIAIAIYLAGQKYLPTEEFDKTVKSERVKPAPMTKDDWLMFAIIVLLVPVMAIGLLPNQEIFNAYLLWGDRDFGLEFMGQTLPTTWLITLDAIVSVSFLAIVALFFRWYATKWQEPDELTKIIIGMIFGIGGMLCLYMAAITKAEGEKIGLFWPVAFHFVNSIGFAMVLPVALALFVRLAPKQLSSTVTGIYTLSFFVANGLVGYIGGFFEKMPVADFWLMHAGFAAFSAAVFIVLKIALRKKLAVV